MKKILSLIIGLFLSATFFVSCKKEAKQNGLSNQFIYRTTEPLIVGQSIDFAYGMGSTNGPLNTAQVIASIPGATGTLFETVTHRTVNAADMTTVVATSSTTSGATSKATLIDTNATTLRYSYIIPEEARGQEVSFNFSVTNKAGDEASTTTPGYKVSKMDMARNITLEGTASGARYFSIADMKAYTQAEVDAGNISSKIDFIYAYAPTITPTTTAYTYGHSLVSPAASGYFPAGFTIPSGWTKNSTLMEKKIGNTLYDGQLKGDPNISIYVDDLDLQKQSFDGSANYAITLANDGSVFMKTADGKYTAFIYVNKVTNASNTAVISLKRLQNF
ncbi:DUF4466 family protein [Mucilaginibacter segetis]|uniref:DUF4466 family protein n=1 Tax=Mucilaginibacter segetis TaxID=2793071 RepID=A0A934UNA3_9SPHI|nr:DUF4466 family protein [Mucilaginibacter segetis]MBK0379702.1 DUF4466 family protein [Mucilaginibacter segetis]